MVFVRWAGGGGQGIASASRAAGVMLRNFFCSGQRPAVEQGEVVNTAAFTCSPRREKIGPFTECITQICDYWVLSAYLASRL